MLGPDNDPSSGCEGGSLPTDRIGFTTEGYVPDFVWCGLRRLKIQQAINSKMTGNTKLIGAGATAHNGKLAYLPANPETFLIFRATGTTVKIRV